MLFKSRDFAAKLGHSKMFKDWYRKNYSEVKIGGKIPIYHDSLS